ncbi:unnamed protein product [Adineta steineri]|uniref:F-box domain-containing protein n=1 Tax=Adineta steineri TaxID=433720 RepID=A0A819HM93_9BILA|nr:unnamed protein product [Adineta steineri]
MLNNEIPGYFQQKIVSISNVSLLDCPIEILHHIFDYLDTQTIFRSFRCVCNQLYATVKTYNRFQLNFTLTSQLHFDFISQFFRSENVISLIYSANCSKQSNKIDFLLTNFDIRQCTRLNSLTLLDVDKTELDRVLPLILLSIQFYHASHSVPTPSLSKAIIKWNLQQLHLINESYITTILSWPVPRPLNHLTIDTSLNRFLQTLTTLSVARNQIEHESIRHLTSTLRSNATLTALSIGENQIGDEGMRHSLHVLDLSSNQLKVSNAQYLASMLENNTTLITLNLRDNKLRSKGIEFIAGALEKNKTLATLNLWNNEIMGVGVRSLANALQKNTALTTLDLGRNRIGTDGTKYLANMLRINSTLTTLDIGSNNIAENGQQNLIDAIQINKTLTTLNLKATPLLNS